MLFDSYSETKLSPNISHQQHQNIVPMVPVDKTIGSHEHRFKIFKSVKKLGMKFYEIFLLIERLKRNFSYISMTLPSDFSEILNIILDNRAFKISVDLRM